MLLLAGSLLTVLLVGALRALVFQLLWNMLIVGMFGCPVTLSFWPAWGLLILANMLASSGITVSTKGS